MRTTIIAGCLAALTAHARAETAIPVESCAQPGNTTKQCWDFEDPSTFSSWTTTGTAFANQPTVGDNVLAERALTGQKSPVTGSSIPGDLATIGGDYWNVPVSIGNQGKRWLGTAEDHNDETAPLGGMQGTSATGTATSPAFVIERNYVTFLIGGTKDLTNETLELQVFRPAEMSCATPRGGTRPVCFVTPARWERAVSAVGESMVRTGGKVEELHRDAFRTDAASGLQGKVARIVITDASVKGSINVDHILHTHDVPNDWNGANVPVWGLADTHAHPGNEIAMRSLGVSNAEGYVFHGSAGTVTTDPAVLKTELASCDGQGHNTVHAARVVIGEMERASLGESPDFPKDCNPGPYMGTCSQLGHKVTPRTPIMPPPREVMHQHFAGGFVSGVAGGPQDMLGWPYWYTRAHQQMHLTWVQRAYQGGQRLMFAAAGNTEVLGMAMRGTHKGHLLSDYGALRRFAMFMTSMAAQNSSWMEIALSPADARRIIKSNKLAIVLATEVDDLGDHCAGDFTSMAPDDPLDHALAATTEGSDPWNMVRDRTAAASCTTAAEWTTRVDNLYRVGYRVILPIHFADNALGGFAIYDEKFNSNTRYVTGNFASVASSTEVAYQLPEIPPYQGWKGFWKSSEAGWTNFWGILGGQSVGYSVAQYAGSPVPYPYVIGQGHINVRPLTPSGEVVLNAAKARGMMIDVAHMSQRTRERVLGLGANAMVSPLNPGCDMSLPICQTWAYPVVSSHAGLRELQVARDYMGGGPDEGGLRRDMILRIRDIGGLIGVGVTAADANSTDVAAPGTWSGVFTQNVANSCAGSSRTFSQSYIYALRMMNGKGITLGTDINGLEDRLNPRYGSQGCYARGNIPHSKQIGADGTSLLVNDTSKMPFKYRENILALADGTAGLQRSNETTKARAINYAHYNLVPPSGPRFDDLLDPPNYLSLLQWRSFNQVGPTSISGSSVKTLGGTAMRASVTGNRTFDLNIDGYAHYGMLPDMLQDTMITGMTADQLAPLFQGAESVIQTWEKGCRLSNASVNALGCK